MISASRLNETMPLMAITVLRPPNLSRSTRIWRSKRPDSARVNPVIRRTRKLVSTKLDTVPTSVTMPSQTSPPPSRTTTTWASWVTNRPARPICDWPVAAAHAEQDGASGPRR